MHECEIAFSSLRAFFFSPLRFRFSHPAKLQHFIWCDAISHADCENKEHLRHKGMRVIDTFVKISQSFLRELPLRVQVGGS